DHRLPAEMTRNVRHLRLRLLTLERPRVLAGLRVVLAGEERSEESAARLELAAAVGAPLVDDRAEIVRLGDERAELHVLERLVERLPEILQDDAPPELPFLDLVQLQLHPGGEVDVEDVGELLDHHLLHRLTELGREEATLLEIDVATIGQHADDARVRRRPADAEPLELLDEAR